MSNSSCDRAHFDALYTADPDPWRFRTSNYERMKYAATVAVIDDRRYEAGLEIGCSIGMLSVRLAPLCARFLGLDISERPLPAARAICATFPAARFDCMKVPTEWPDGRFDLIILSEVLYFLSAADIAATAERVRGSLLPDGRVLLVNWLGAAERPQPGDSAAERFLAATALLIEKQSRQALYRIDLLATN
jgi:cyclopropane fatty-acyl-phospholipid synthase-like methyltransferase